jgi:hypothetical protein
LKLKPGRLEAPRGTLSISLANDCGTLVSQDVDHDRVPSAAIAGSESTGATPDELPDMQRRLNNREGVRSDVPGWKPPVDKGDEHQESPLGLSDEEAIRRAEEDPITRACRATSWFDGLAPHPTGPVARDVVRDGASPFDDRLIAILPKRVYVKTKSHRYAIAYNLVRAINWGRILFGTQAFALFEGPLEKNPDKNAFDSAYYVVPLDYALEIRDSRNPADAILGLETGPSEGTIRARTGGRNVFGVAVRWWFVEQRAPDRRSVILRLLGTSNEASMIFPMQSWLFYCEYERQIASIVSDEA